MITEDDVKIRFTTTAEERKIIRDRLNKLTTPFGKKEGCETTTNRDDKREAMSLSIPQLSPNKSIRSHSFSFKIREARRKNMLNISTGLFHSPTFDASLSNSTKFNTKEV